jgi:two-component system, chemotaxis family, CheB/CheR fusion protein
MSSRRDVPAGAVLIVAPMGRDAALAASTLEQAGVPSAPCADLAELTQLLNDTTGAALVAEEALSSGGVPQLLDWLRQQPTWSDLPLLILTNAHRPEESSARILHLFGATANVALIERPLGGITLVSAVQTALRARRRQHQVRELVEQRETLLSSISDAFSALDHEWRYTYVNAKVAELAGISREQLIGRVIWEVFPTAVNTEFYHRCHRAMETKQSDHFEAWYEPWQRWVETRIYPTAEGIAVLRADITARKNSELALQQAKQEAEQANRAKDQFLAMLSHELRTPLTPVLMTIAALRRQDDLPDELRRDLEMLQRNVELEALLIDDLLDLTRIAHGKLELHNDAVDVHATLEHALNICAADLRDKDLSVVRKLEAKEHHSWADAARVQQVFWNLVKNAVKFTPAGGRIEVATHNDAEHNVIIEISDTGIGIEQQLLSRIFDAFEQGGRRTTTQYGGLGLGLAICKRVVDLHGGSITAASDGAGRGAKFTVTLKAMETSLLAGPVVYAEESAPAGAVELLLVEDHADTARVLRRVLEHAGYSVKHAASLAEARELAATNAFELVISDVGLPDGSGLELMRSLHSSYGLRGIALSGFGTDDDRTASHAAGFAEHLTKPVDWPQLRGAIERLLASKRTEPELQPSV